MVKKRGGDKMEQTQLIRLCGLDDTACSLAAIYCRGNGLSPWFAEVDFEALRPEVSCMAAAAGSATGFSDVPETLIPRLKGIVKYVHTLNTGMTAGVCTLAAALNQAGITPLLLDDTALYLNWPTATQRHLWQMNIAVTPKEFSELAAIAQQAGFQTESVPGGMIIRRGVTQQIFAIALKDSAYQRRGAAILKKGTAQFLCPTPAAVLVGLIQRAFRALLRPNCRADILRWCMDMKHLLSQLSETDWQMAQEIAKTEQAQSHVQLLLDIYQQVTGTATPSLGPEASAETLLRLIPAFRERKRGKLWLFCRLRRPDSVPAAGIVFIKEALKKFYSP